MGVSLLGESAVVCSLFEQNATLSLSRVEAIGDFFRFLADTADRSRDTIRMAASLLGQSAVVCCCWSAVSLSMQKAILSLSRVVLYLYEEVYSEETIR
jgi:hypothetical protein